MFEKIQKTYEAAKSGIKEGIEKFRKKFEGTRDGLAKEVASAKSPEELIALGKKLQEQGEALRAEESEVNKNAENSEMAAEISKEYDEEIAYQNAAEKTNQLEVDRKKDEEESAAKAAEILKNLNGRASNESEVAVSGKSSKELKEQYKALDNLAGVNLGTLAFQRKTEELMQHVREGKNYPFLEGQAKEEAEGKAMEKLQIMLDANAEIMAQMEKENPKVFSEKEMSPEEKMDDYIAKFKKIGGEHGSYNLAFNSMRNDKAINFDNDDRMVIRFIKGMGNIDAVSVLNNLGNKKTYPKNTVLEIINLMPLSNASDFYRGGYNELRILAMRSGLEKDKDVKEAIVRKNPNMESIL